MFFRRAPTCGELYRWQSAHTLKAVCSRFNGFIAAQTDTAQSRKPCTYVCTHRGYVRGVVVVRVSVNSQWKLLPHSRLQDINPEAFDPVAFDFLKPFRGLIW
ncbi:MAG: hypothetical protein GY820_00420 [Gammaproteobacteria bacterium]|nr:hypothetical protein [Gammaproteobacteria bacterium]